MLLNYHQAINCFLSASKVIQFKQGHTQNFPKIVLKTLYLANIY